MNLAPNGNKSNLTPEQYKLVRTTEFKDWFGDWQNDSDNSSKVIDKNGEPLVVHHGTLNGGFTIFKSKKFPTAGYFAEDYNFSKHFINTKKKYTNIVENEMIYSVFLSIKNPIDFKRIKDGYEDITIYEFIENLPYKIDKDKDSWLDIYEKKKVPLINYLSNVHVINSFKRNGYDGVTFHESTPESINKYINSHIDKVTTTVSWIAFSSNQIKLASDINKTFDVNNDDIRFDSGGITEDKKEVYKKWKSLVNMSKSELEKFYNSKEGKEAGLSPTEAKDKGIDYGRKSARWIIKMKDTPVSEWTNEMWEWANKQISFISRMSANKGKLYDDKGEKTRKHTSLLIWGHNPEKNFKDGGKTPNNSDFVNSEKNSKFISNNISINEAKYVISGESNVRNGYVIQTITNYLRKSPSPSSTTKDSKLYKNEEAERLKSYINLNNLWVSGVDYNKYLTEGAEQKVYLFDENNVVKINDSIFYNSWEDYFYSLLLHNYFFPDTAYELMGFLEKDNLLYSVVKQPFIEETEKTDLEAVKKFMAQNGFINNKNNDYFNPELGIILEDLHDENVLTKHGLLYFIDTVFYTHKMKFNNGGQVTINNYHTNTFANFTQISSKEIPERKPDFISDYGSKYWYDGDYVIRQSDHWGKMDTCTWILNSSHYNILTQGKCKLSEFVINNNLMENGGHIRYRNILPQESSNKERHKYDINSSDIDKTDKEAINYVRIIPKYKKIAQDEAELIYKLFYNYESKSDNSGKYINDVKWNYVYGSNNKESIRKDNLLKKKLQKLDKKKIIIFDYYKGVVQANDLTIDFINSVRVKLNEINKKLIEINEDEELSLLIELTEETLNQNPNDEELILYLELLKETIKTSLK